MSRFTHIISVTILIASVSLWSPRAQSDSMKEFVTSCTYGVLAGTLVGAASLAFTDAPGDNLNNIARGASIGLYAGILLGAYVVYGVSDGTEEPEGEQEPTPENDPGAPPADEGQTRIESIYPLFSQNGSLDGAGLNIRLISF